MKASKSSGFEKIARRIAECSSLEFRHATLVFRGGALVAWGYNHNFKHSEVNALEKVWPNKRKGCVIYNVRVRVDRTLAMSRPCPGCMRYLAQNGISKVYYTNRDGRIVSERI